jgi:hypothetical protein
MTEAQLNTVGYVLSRYGGMTGRDLETLSHNQAPWREADKHRNPGGSVRIEPESIAAFFAADGEEYDPPLDSDAVRAWLADTEEPPPGEPDESDDMGCLAAMREELLARTARV